MTSRSNASPVLSRPDREPVARRARSQAAAASSTLPRFAAPDGLLRPPPAIRRIQAELERRAERSGRIRAYLRQDRCGAGLDCADGGGRVPSDAVEHPTAGLGETARCVRVDPHAAEQRLQPDGGLAQRLPWFTLTEHDAAGQRDRQAHLPRDRRAAAENTSPAAAPPSAARRAATAFRASSGSRANRSRPAGSRLQSSSARGVRPAIGQPEHARLSAARHALSRSRTPPAAGG